jgi:hypothetical protein
MTFRGSEFGGPQFGWGSVPNSPETGGGRTQHNSGRVRGQFGASPEAGLRRGEWQRQGRAPDAAAGYGWEYQGGAGRDARTLRSEAGMGSRGYYEARLAEERSGGLPRERQRFSGDRMWDRMAGDRSRGTGRGMGGYGRDFAPRYGRDYDDRAPLEGGFDRLERLEHDPRWQGDSHRIRRELETGPGRTRWNWRDDSEVTRDRGILRGYDGGFGFRRPR